MVNSFSNVGRTIAPGEIVTLYGCNIGASVPATARLKTPGVLDTNVANTRILFDNLLAPIISTSLGQVSVTVPYGVGGRSQTNLQVEAEGRITEPITLPVAPTSPGVASLDQSGTGPGVILNEDGTLNSPGNPAKRGSIVVFFVTGEGQTVPAGVDGKIADLDNTTPRPAAPVLVTIGEVEVPVLYAGGIPGVTSGIMQVNARVGIELPKGSAVPIVISVGGRASQDGIAVSVQ